MRPEAGGPGGSRRGHPHARRAGAVATGCVLAAALAASGCADFGHAELARDQLGYSQSLTESQKAQTLLNIIRLRYGSVPVFLNATQVIAGYQLERSASLGGELFPTAAASTYATGAAVLQLRQSPTFTFQPVGGKDFTESYVRPLSPAGLYPLTVGNLPIDVLLRLAVTSLGPLRNVNVFSDDRDGSTAPFFEALAGLRALQLAGLIEIGLAGGEGGSKPTVVGDRLVLTFRPARTPQQSVLLRHTRHLLGLGAGTTAVDVVYGTAAASPDELPVVTRSILGILTAVAFDIDVPRADVEAGVTLAGLTGGGRRPELLVRSSLERPDDAFVAVSYRGRWFFISDVDFDSKVAFGVLQLLISLAQTPQASEAIVTVPAR